MSHPLLYLAMNHGIRANVKSDALLLPKLERELFGKMPEPEFDFIREPVLSA